MKVLSIIGPGRVGKSLGRRIAMTGTYAIDQVLAHSQLSAKTAVAFIGSGTPIASIKALDLGAPQRRMLMITTPDDTLHDIARRVAEQSSDLTGLVVFHCSGAVPSSVLAPLQALGARAASLHPIKSFSDPATAVDTLPGTFFTLEANLAIEELAQLTADMGGHTLTIAPEHKARYHLAIVFVCNYLYALLHIGVTSLERIGVDASLARQAIAPILRETVENGLRFGPGPALTGPIARGDLAVIEKHLTELQSHPALDDAYRALGVVTAQMAQAEGLIESEIEKRLLEVLKRSPS